MDLLKNVLKFLFSAKGLILAMFFSFLVLIYFNCSWALEYHSKEEMIQNFEKRKQAIIEVKNYFNAITPKNKKIEIEFTNNNQIERFGIYTIDSLSNGIIAHDTFLDWRLKVTAKKTDSLITTLGWTRQTLMIIKNKLDKAGCIQIESGNPTIIGFQRTGMGMLLYNIFNEPIPKNKINDYNDSCTYIYYNPCVVLEYSGGALGSQCFPKN